jgi:HTH-type transcriptional regulator, sugar sensing transcriptional regulator
MDISILEEIGLTKSETNVYLALLELGSTSTGKIVDKSGAASSKIYEILDRLMQKGLVSYVIKNGVKYFEAAPPERIMDYMEEKEEHFQKQKNKLKNILPELELKRTLSKYKSEATIYKGIKGVETAFYSALDLLEDGDEMLVTGIPKRTDVLNRFFLKFGKEREKRNILMRALFNEDAKNDAQIAAVFSEIKFMSQTTPAAINIFNNRVLIFPETEENLLISIDSKEVAESFRVQFEMQWNQDTNTTTGFENVTTKFDNMLEELKEGDEYYVLGASLELKDQKMNDWTDEFHKKRFEQKKKVKFLTSYEAYDLVKNSVMRYGDKNLEITKMKRLSPEFSAPFQINLWKGDRVWFTFWEKDMRCFEILSKDAYNHFKKYFDALWNQETMAVKGFDNLKFLLRGFIDELKENNEDYLAIGAGFGPKASERKYLDFFKENAAYRNKLGVNSKLLFQQGMEQTVKERKKYLDNPEIKHLPYSTKTPVSIMPSKDKTLLIIQDKEPTTVVIENELIGKAFIENFNSLWNQKTAIYEGLDKVKQLMLEMVNYGDYKVIAEGNNYLFKTLGRKFFDEWQEKKKELGVKSQGVTEYEYKGQYMITKSTANFRFIKDHKSPATTFIFKDRIITINFSDRPIANMIHDTQVANDYRIYFETLWNKAEK